MFVTVPRLLAAASALASLMLYAASRSDDVRPAPVIAAMQEEAEQMSTRKQDRIIVRPDDAAIRVVLLQAAGIEAASRSMNEMKEEAPPERKIERSERSNRRAARSHDICRGKGRRYYRHGTYWRCRR